MEAPKKTWTGLRRLRSHMDAQGSRKTAKPRNHCGHREEVPDHTKGVPGHASYLSVNLRPPSPLQTSHQALPQHHTELPQHSLFLLHKQ